MKKVKNLKDTRMFINSLRSKQDGNHKIVLTFKDSKILSKVEIISSVKFRINLQSKFLLSQTYSTTFRNSFKTCSIISTSYIFALKSEEL